jgi:hypothetical protein
MCHTRFLEQNRILIACMVRNNNSIHTDICVVMSNVTNKIFIIIRILSFKRLNDPHNSRNNKRFHNPQEYAIGAAQT